MTYANTGTRVYWVSQTGLWDTTTAGTVIDDGPIEPIGGEPHPELRWVAWDEGDDSPSLESIDDLVVVETSDA